MKRVNCAGGIVLNTEGLVLIVTNEIGSRTFPKGSIKKGEKPLEAARREIAEETGITQLEVHREVGTIIRPGYTAENAETSSVIKHIHMFLCTTAETNLQPTASDVAHATWVEPSQVAITLSRREEAKFFEQQREYLITGQATT